MSRLVSKTRTPLFRVRGIMTVRKNTMIVYRFEKKGIGPYVSRTSPPNGSFYRKSGTTRTEKKYSTLFDQRVLGIDHTERMKNWVIAHSDKKYMYGCSSKEMLRTYFGGNFKSYFQQGFRIKRYRVPDEEVINMGIEVAFPVRYHKLRTVSNIQKAS